MSILIGDRYNLTIQNNNELTILPQSLSLPILRRISPEIGQKGHQNRSLRNHRTLMFISPYQELFVQHPHQHIDAFHHYFLSAMAHNSKTREIACNNYDKLLRQGLVDKDHLPPSLISSALTACSSAGLAGGSTSGSSSLGSTSLAASSLSHAIHIGNMIKTMLLTTSQPNGELTQGLNYLLEGTRRKHGLLYGQMLEEVYRELLVKKREQPVKVFAGNYL